MQQDYVKNTCQSLELPLYALIHDSVVHALKTARVSRQVALAVVEQIAKLPISPKEQKELEKAQGSIQLEDSFGSGEFYLIDAGSNGAFVFSDEKNAKYLDQILQSRSDQDFMPQNDRNNQQDMQNQDQNQNQNENQNLNQNKYQNQNENQNLNQNQNSSLDQETLIKLQVLENILNTNGQNQSQHTIKVGQSKSKKDQNLLQKMLLLELMQGKDTKELLEKLQTLQMIEEFSQSQNSQKNS
jgi:hypothetical protein